MTYTLRAASIFIRVLGYLALLNEAAAAPTEKLLSAPAANHRVCMVQILLKRAGFDPGPIDCKNGKQTTRALMRLQSRFGLEPTGRLDPTTILALRAGVAGLACSGSRESFSQCLARLGESAKQTSRAPSIRRRFSVGRCALAYETCVDSCPHEIFDYERSEYVAQTDFYAQCESACESGASECEDADRDDRCDEFMSACESDCPSDVFDYAKSAYLLITDADRQCESACEDGQAACE